MPLDAQAEKALVNALFELEDEIYIVDNVHLNTKSKGIRYRASPDVDDLDPQPNSVAKFGQVVEGISWPDKEWLLLDGFGKRRFLPKRLYGVPVLMPVRVREGNQAYFDVDWPAAQTDQQPDGGRQTQTRPGARQSTANRRGQSPAAGSGKVEVKLSKEEEELLQVASSAIKSRDELVNVLVQLRSVLERGGDRIVDVRGPDGCTALMRAARRGNLDICVVLLRHGADAAVCTSEGHSAADFASWPPCKALIRALSGDVGNADRQDLHSALEKLQPSLRTEAEEICRRAAEEALLGERGTPEPPKQPASTTRRGGVPFIVFCQEAPVYEYPSPSAEELTVFKKDEVVDVYGYDHTRTWARVKVQLPHGSETGWVRLEDDIAGELLKPIK